MFKPKSGIFLRDQLLQISLGEDVFLVAEMAISDRDALFVDAADHVDEARALILIELLHHGRVAEVEERRVRERLLIDVVPIRIRPPTSERSSSNSFIY